MIIFQRILIENSQELRNFLWIYMLKDLKAEIQGGEHGYHTYPMYSPLKTEKPMIRVQSMVA